MKQIIFYHLIFGKLPQNFVLLPLHLFVLDIETGNLFVAQLVIATRTITLTVSETLY